MNKIKRKSKVYRKIYEKNFGQIPDGWVVHHIDCNEENNSPCNLIAMPEHAHNYLHTLMQRHNKILNREEIKEWIESYFEFKRKKFLRSYPIRP